jgi:hypothetical protein
MVWYYIHNANKNITSTNPNLTISTFSFGVEIGGVNCGTCDKQYRSDASSISAFRNIKQRLVFGNKNFNKVSVWCHARSGSPYGTIKTWVDVTEQFTIKTYPSNGIIDLQATSDFKYSSSYVYLYVAIDEEFSTTYTITNNNTNCICNSVIKSEYKKNENISLEFTANEGYIFKSNSISLTTGALNNASTTYSDDRKTLTLTGAIIGNLTINVIANAIYNVSITGTLKNCICNYSDGEVITEDKPDIILTANNGYEFNGVYNYVRGTTTHSFSVSDDKKTLSTHILDGYNYKLNDEYKATKIVEKIGNFANLYYTNESELTELSKVRFVSDSSATVDYGSFITALYKLPFPIDSGILTEEKSNIILGNYDSNVKSTRLITYKTEIDGGTISVPEKYKNVYDYLNTECILHLPHFNKMHINTEYVIGQTLTIKYIIDLYTGNVTANVYSSFIDDIIETQTQQIAENIPFIQKQNNSVVGTVSNINKNVITTAFIEIVRNIPYDNENIFGKETIDYCVIGTKTGYIKVSDVVLNCTATVEEKEEIEQLLKEGVFINGH